MPYPSHGVLGTASILCYAEEFREVVLTQLGSINNRHTWAFTTSDVEDLFVQICRARINRRLLVSGLSSDIETEIRQRLHLYVTDNRLRICYCPCQSGSSSMERQWVAHPDFLSEPYSEPDLDTYRTLLTDVFGTFLRHPGNFSPAVLQLMDNKVTLRSDALRTNILDTTSALTAT